MNLLARDEKHGIITQLSSSETETMLSIKNKMKFKTILAYSNKDRGKSNVSMRSELITLASPVQLSVMLEQLYEVSYIEKRACPPAIGMEMKMRVTEHEESNGGRNNHRIDFCRLVQINPSHSLTK